MEVHVRLLYLVNLLSLICCDSLYGEGEKVARMSDYFPPAEQAIVEIAAAPARPGHFAEREELDAALKAGTSGALLLFIERHPMSRYRAEAEAALRQLGLTPPAR